MTTLVHQRCFHHSLREAVARCPECRQFFCRECITEHDDRVICATCLAKIGAITAPRRQSLDWLMPFLHGAIGFAVVALFFYLFGTMLLSLPSSFHEGTLWMERFWE